MRVYVCVCGAGFQIGGRIITRYLPSSIVMNEKKKDFASLVSDKHFQILFPIEVTPKLNSLLFRSHFFGRRVFDASSDGRCVL